MNDFEQLDYYEILGVDRSASPEEIKRAFRQAISLYHPDRYIGKSPEEQQYASARAQRITEAYRVLGDQKNRTRYNLGNKLFSRSAPPQPPQPRDHLAELYDQAQEHLQAQRYLQAAAVLRQIQQLSPFYRDSAQMLAQAERHLGAQPQPQLRRRIPLLVLAGGAGALLLVVLAMRSFSRPTAAQPPLLSPPTAIVEAPVIQPTIAASLVPTLAPTLLPTSAPTLAPSPAPSATPSVEPTIEPTVAPSPAPSPTPTLAPTLEPSPDPALANLENGALLVSNSLGSGSGWAIAGGNGWSVGSEQNGYRITAAPGIGDIWSYRTLPADEPLTIGVDVLAAGGEAGLVTRFIDGNNYLSFSVDPASDTFRVRRYRGGAAATLVSESAGGILKPGEFNRLVVALRESTVQFAINGRIMADLELQAPADSSRYGLVATGTDVMADALFANLAIYVQQ